MSYTFIKRIRIWNFTLIFWIFLARSRSLPSTSAVQQPDYVFSIEPVRCKTMYGYTENDEQFAKVKFLNPIYVNK